MSLFTIKRLTHNPKLPPNETESLEGVLQYLTLIKKEIKCQIPENERIFTLSLGYDKNNTRIYILKLYNGYRSTEYTKGEFYNTVRDYIEELKEEAKQEETHKLLYTPEVRESTEEEKKAFVHELKTKYQQFNSDFLKSVMDLLRKNEYETTLVSWLMADNPNDYERKLEAFDDVRLNNNVEIDELLPILKDIFKFLD